MSDRPDPRDRPPDPAGTQPKHDPETLVPDHAPPERPALGPGEHEWLPEPPEPAGEPVVAAGPAIPRETQHTPRFQFLLGALLAVGAVALAAAVAIALRPATPSVDPAAGGSPWRPSAGNAISDIADHVAEEHRPP